MELKIIKTKDDFLAAKMRWQEIYSAMKDASPFQSWEWNFNWWDSHIDGELCVLEAIESERTFAFMPLIIVGKEIKLIGDKHFDYGLIIVAERKRAVFDFFIKNILHICKERKLTFRFANIPITSSQYAFFKEYATKNKKVAIREQVSTANLKLEEYGCFQRYLTAISSSLRKKAIKPCLKADLQYQLEDFDENLWEDIERIYCARQEDRVGVSTLAWAKEVVRRLAQQKILYISTLKKDNKRIAFLIFFNDSNSYYIWLTAFQKTNDLRLGHYIRYCLIEKAYNENISVVDMMRGAYDYKKEWDCNVTFNYEFIIFRSRWKKRMYLWKQKLRKRIRNIVYNNKFLKKIYQKKSKH